MSGIHFLHCDGKVGGEKPERARAVVDEFAVRLGAKKKKRRVRCVKESADDTLCEKSASRVNKLARQLTSVGVEHWGGWEEVVKEQRLVEGTRGIVSRAFCGETFRSSCVSATLNGDVVLCQCRTSAPHPPPFPSLTDTPLNPFRFSSPCTAQRRKREGRAGWGWWGSAV